MSDKIDFERLASELSGRARDLVPSWLPGGKMQGREYCCGDLTGKPGDSLRVNLDTGKWADFATDEKGGDLISLYAAIHRLSQIEAAKALVEKEGVHHAVQEQAPPPAKKEVKKLQPVKPPLQCPKPNFKHSKFGDPVGVWPYLDANSELLFYVVRYDSQEGKQLFPISWVDSRWQFKGWLPPRPLYGLNELAKKQNKPVLIVEGEKAAEAAKSIVGERYAVVTWPNGSKAIGKADWSVLSRRKILIWPDADEAGKSAADDIAKILKQNCDEVKIIRPEGKSKGWDAADAVSLGWSWAEFVDWAKARVELITDKPVKVADSEPSPASATMNIQVNNYNIFAEEVHSVSGSLTALYEQLGVPTTDKGAAICNADAALRVLEGIPEFKDLVWFDEFHNKYLTNWNSDKPTEWSSYHDGELLIFMQRHLGMIRIGAEHIKAAVKSYGMRNIKNEPRDWMKSLKWDGEERIELFMTDAYGADMNEYVRAVSKNFWIGLAARVFYPGCKLDNMVVLEGGQGIGKTTSLEIIGGEWFTDIKDSLSSKDFFISLQGKMIIEIAELDTFNKADVTRIKQVVTSRNDRYRDPYDDRAKDHPRMCVFVGSTNETQWQRDSTGGRRFWPITCKFFNLSYVKEYREQFFAEAVHRLKAGEGWYKTPADQTLAEQERRRQADEWEDIVAHWLSGGIQGMLIQETTIRQIAVDCLKIDEGRLDVLIQRRIGKVLHTIGWEKNRVVRNGVRTHVWTKVKGEENAKILEAETIY